MHQTTTVQRLDPSVVDSYHNASVVMMGVRRRTE